MTVRVNPATGLVEFTGRANMETRVTGGGTGGGGSPSSSGYYVEPAVSRIDRETRVTGGGTGALGGFADLSGFSSGADAFAWGFNPALKARDALGGEVNGDEIESSRIDAESNVILASQGSSDFGNGLLSGGAGGGPNKALIILGLAGLALVGYSFVK